MSRGRQYIEFEGLFSENVLGIFLIIRPRNFVSDSLTLKFIFRFNKKPTMLSISRFQQLIPNTH